MIASNARTAFLYGVLCATLDIVVFRRGTKESLNSGIAFFIGATTYLIADDFLQSEHEYINERTKKDN